MLVAPPNSTRSTTTTTSTTAVTSDNVQLPKHRTVVILKRSSSFNDSKTHVRKAAGRQHIRGEKTRLSCVLEQADSVTDYPTNRKDKKLLNSDNNSSTNELKSSKRQERQANGMSTWKISPATSPDNASSTSWIDNISNMISDKTKRKANGFFGSLRSKNNKEKRRPNSSSVMECPRSPLLVTRPGSGGARVSVPRTARGTTPVELQGSSGFITVDSDAEDSSIASDHIPPSRNEFGSCHELSNMPQETKKTVNLRKSNSLPRTLLSSPVPRYSQYPTSHWLDNDQYFEESVDLPESLSSSSYKGSSCETIQPGGLIADTNSTTPTDKVANYLGGWKSVSPCMEPKSNLIRSSSLPFETSECEGMLLPQRGEVPGRLGLGGGAGHYGSRLAMRSQSFNAHSHVQRTHSQESVAMREHIIRFLLETEQSYISSLQTLSKDYQDILYQIDCQSLQEVLLLVPNLASLHQDFVVSLSERIREWCEDQCIGDLLVQTFSHQNFNKLYTLFIHHYSQARTALENAKQTKPSLSKALEDLSRETRGKLTLEDLLIKPVQRIPRYLLFVKDLMKQTPPAHPDYYELHLAQKELSTLASSVNEAERVSERLQQLKDLLTMVEGLPNVLNDSSSLIRLDNVKEISGNGQKKDRLILLFNDMVICCSSRRRSSGFRKGSFMNVNSLQVEMLKYRVKWAASLSVVAVNHTPTPLMERRKHNTLEKTLNSLHKDEGVILQMIATSSTIQYSHTELDNTLQSLLASLKIAIAKKKQEIDSLPQDSARVELLSHELSPPSKYNLVFTSQKERQEWEQALHSAQVTLSRQQKGKKDSAYLQTPQVECIPRYFWHVGLPPCRVGSQVSSIALPTTSSNQFFVCINDSSGRGNIAILNSRTRLSRDSPPTLVATLPLSSSRLLSSVCVEHQSHHKYAAGEGSNNLVINYIKDDVITDEYSSPDETLVGCDDSFFPFTPPTPSSAGKNSLVDTLTNSPVKPSSLHLNRPTSCIVPSNNREYRLAPPTPEGNQWLWLGSEEGIIYVLKIGVASLHVSSSLSINLGSSVVCLTAYDDEIWAGLANGRIAVFNLQRNISHPDRSLSVSASPIIAIASSSPDHQKLVATGNKIVGVDASWSCKEIVNSSETISNMVVNDKWIFTSLKDTLTIKIYSCHPEKESSMTVDCTPSVTASLKYYDPIIRQHKCTNPFITKLALTEDMLVIGTSTGVVIAMPLPLASGKVPSLHALSRGHVDGVSTLAVTSWGHKRQVLLSSGHGLEELLKARSSDNISETEGCLLCWFLSRNSKIKAPPT